MKYILLFFFLITSMACSEPIPSGFNTNEINIEKEPEQIKNIDTEPITISGKNYSFTLTPLALYKISGLVKSKKKYSNDWNSILSPMDVALVWGKLANSDVDKYIKYWQRNRWYYYRYEAGTPVSKDYIINHSSNNHLIPANENIKNALNLIETNKEIYIEGYLVNIKGKYKGNDYWWNSSLSRLDTGDGSCEVIYVMKINISGKIFQ